MEDKQKNDFWEEETQPVPRRKTGRISIKSVMLLTAVFAATAVCLGQLIRAVNGEKDQNLVGQFAVMNAMMPTVFLVGAFWFFKIFGRFID